LNTAADKDVLAALNQLAALPAYSDIFCMTRASAAAEMRDGALSDMLHNAFGVGDKFQQLLAQEQHAHPTAPSAQRIERLRETARGLACCHMAFMSVCGAALRDAYPAAVSLLCATAPASAVAAPAATTRPAPHADGVDAVVARLRGGSMSAEQCADCCRDMPDVIKADASYSDASHRALSAAVRAALEQHASDAPMHVAGWALLAKLALPAAGDRPAVSETLRVAMPCLHVHAARGDVVGNVLSALTAIADKCDSFPAPLCEQIQKAVIAAMHAHPSVKRVQAYGLVVLGACLTSCPTGIPPFVLNPAILHMVIAAMRDHSTDAVVQNNACWLIVCVCELLHKYDAIDDDDGTFFAFNRAWLLVSAGCIEAAVVALQMHPDNTGIAKNVCSLLCWLVRGHAENAARAVRAGALALRLPLGVDAETQRWWNALHLDFQPAAAAQADAAMAALLAEEEAERAARGSAAGQSTKKAAKRRGCGGAIAGGDAASGDAGISEASSGIAPLQAAGFAPEGGHDAPDVAAAAEDAGSTEAVAPSASAERRRRRAAAKAAKRAGSAPTDSAVPAAAPIDAAVETDAAQAAMEAPQAAEANDDDDAVTTASSPPVALPLPPAAPAPPIMQHADASLAAQLAAQLASELAVAQAALAKAEAEVDAARCVICMDAPRCCVVLPCKHLALCASPACAAMLGAPPRCPLCRRGVTDTMQLFV
jgi:hypothetical protein